MKIRILATSVLLISAMSCMFHDEASAAEKKVALMWQGKSVMQNRVMLGFLARSREIEPNLAVSVKMEIPTPQEAEDTFWEFEKNVDGIIYLRSFGAEFLARVKTGIPLFIGGCNDPRALGVVKNLESPEGNITGVTYHIPFEKRFEAIKALFPHAKNIGIVLQKDHPVTAIEGPATREQCQKLGLHYHEILPKDRRELSEAVALLAPNVDLIIISNCVVAFDNVTAILPVANKRRIPIFSYEAKAVHAGAVAGIAASDEKLGRLLADSVVDVVVKGKPIAQVPVKMDPDPRFLVNVTMMRSLGLTFPERIMEKAELIE